jgi:hypothetical protein
VTAVTTVRRRTATRIRVALLLLARAGRDVLLTAMYRPARMQGRPVPQLVMQEFTFKQ